MQAMLTIAAFFGDQIAAFAAVNEMLIKVSTNLPS
jgi:hypothetical protein